MMLSLLRHGIAVERGSPGAEHDSERPLTAKGDRRMRRIAAGMLALGLSYDVILSSPYLRARQTAEIAAQVLKMPDRVHLSDTLMPEGDPRQLIEALRTDHRQRQ